MGDRTITCGNASKATSRTISSTARWFLLGLVPCRWPFLMSHRSSLLTLIILEETGTLSWSHSGTRQSVDETGWLLKDIHIHSIWFTCLPSLPHVYRGFFVILDVGCLDSKRRAVDDLRDGDEANHTQDWKTHIFCRGWVFGVSALWCQIDRLPGKGFRNRKAPWTLSRHIWM